MLLRYYSLLVFVFLIGFAKAQSNRADDLWAQWNNSNLTDEKRLDAINELAKEVYLYSIPDSAMYCTRLQIKLAKKTKNQKQLANAYNTQGVYFALKSDYYNSIEKFEQSLKIYKSIKYSKGIASALNNLGLVKNGQGMYEEAIGNFTESLRINKSIDDKQNTASCLNNIGIVFRDQGEYDRAKDYFEQSLEINLELDYELGVASGYNNIGLIYSKKGDLDHAIEFYKKSLTIVEGIGDKNRTAAALNNIGEIYYSRDSLKLAYEYFSRSLEIKKLADHKQGIASGLINLGMVEEANSEIDEAIKLYQEALNVAQTIGASNEIKDASYRLHLIYKELGDFEMALPMYELYIKKLTELENVEVQKSILHKEWEYKFQQKELADSLETVRKEKVNTIKAEKERSIRISVYIIIALMATIVVFYLRYKWAKNKAEQTRLLDDIKVLKSEVMVKKAMRMNQLSKPELNKEKLEDHIQAKLNATDWKILNVLFDNPAITNKSLAEEVSLSVEGTRSSLGKMYRLFNINTGRNQRFILIMEATKISG
ncbi:MAG: tetratricopeptide repeat protein [Crocinitomicaceae bacterium]|nr:tetratricopeptide repeat protein [Flavobacteriales bacterium]NQZ38410.1 tetratricopeptide repeat protein [Crocinitomicaceae bacterium]